MQVLQQQCMRVGGRTPTLVRQQQQQHLQQHRQHHHHHQQQQQQQQQQVEQQQPRRGPTAASARRPTTRRELVLFGAGLAATLTAAAPAQAAITLTMRPKAQLKPYTLKAGYSVTVPDTWGLAYDRSADEKLGAQSFFADFKTFTTCSILKLAKPEGQLSPQQLLEWVLAEQKNNQSTFDFQLLTGDTPTQRSVPTADSAAEDTFYDSEYSLAICRGLTQEGAGGSKRCIGPRDMDLEVVSRTFYQAFTVRQDFIYIVRASTTSQQWQDLQGDAREAVHSFRLPAALA